MVEKIWVFKNENRIPDKDLKLIIPTGRIKLIIPFHNVSTDTNGTLFSSKKDFITLIGVTDSPRVINDEKDNPSGTIGIEFSPEGAYRCFRLNYSEFKNRIYTLADVIGSEAIKIQEELSNFSSAETKVNLLQKYLLKKLLVSEADSVLDYCVRKIKQSQGRTSVRDLEKETGYSSRWLNMKFQNRVGISPKSLSEIIRFHSVYRALTRDPFNVFIQKEFYNYYYDQSHFIRDFKRFTGLPPSKLALETNNFGKLFNRS